MDIATRIVTSPALIVKPAEGELVTVYDFLTKNCAEISLGALYWFNYFRKATTLADATNDHREFTAGELVQELQPLLDENFLVAEGTAHHRTVTDFSTSWTWDVTSALFHFTILNSPYLNAEEGAKRQVEKVALTPSPSLTWRNGNAGTAMPAPGSSMPAPVFRNMLQRRTNRHAAPRALTAGQLSDCLFAGLGITGFVEVPLGTVPLSMTPSGGARNPYEAFVIVRSASDLPAGIYHYSAEEHSLALRSSAVPQSVAELFASQEWVDDVPAIIVLVAMFERTMWKYPDPNAYRVAMIEAGHIGQNIMLAATSMGLTVCPTAALSHDALSSLFGVSGMTHAPVYALTVAHPAPSEDVVISNHLIPQIFA